MKSEPGPKEAQICAIRCWVPGTELLVEAGIDVSAQRGRTTNVQDRSAAFVCANGAGA